LNPGCYAFLSSSRPCIHNPFLLPVKLRQQKPKKYIEVLTIVFCDTSTVAPIPLVSTARPMFRGELQRRQLKEVVPCKWALKCGVLKHKVRAENGVGLAPVAISPSPLQVDRFSYGLLSSATGCKRQKCREDESEE
jgi:hypothetical protein